MRILQTETGVKSGYVLFTLPIFLTFLHQTTIFHCAAVFSEGGVFEDWF